MLNQGWLVGGNLAGKHINTPAQSGERFSYLPHVDVLSACAFSTNLNSWVAVYGDECNSSSVCGKHGLKLGIKLVDVFSVSVVLTL
jgi:hypothetical protein